MVDEWIEQSMPAFLRNVEPINHAGAHNRMRYLMDRRASSLKDKAALYFRIPPEDSEARSNMGFPEADEYEIAAAMWDKFGISAIELEKCDAFWVNKMLICMSEDNKAQNERMKRQIQS